MASSVLVATVGLPRSGKSTWARASGYPIVCPDAIRFALHGQRFQSEAEPMVWVLAQYMVRSLFFAGHDVVVFDATNTTVARREELEKWGRDRYRVRFYAISTSEQECLRRARSEGDDEIMPIIMSMAQKYEPLQGDEGRWLVLD